MHLQYTYTKKRSYIAYKFIKNCTKLDGRYSGFILIIKRRIEIPGEPMIWVNELLLWSKFTLGKRAPPCSYSYYWNILRLRWWNLAPASSRAFRQPWKSRDKSAVLSRKSKIRFCHVWRLRLQGYERCIWHISRNMRILSVYLSLLVSQTTCSIYFCSCNRDWTSNVMRMRRDPGKCQV